MANNSRGVLKFDGGEAQKVLKLNYTVQRSTDVTVAQLLFFRK